MRNCSIGYSRFIFTSYNAPKVPKTIEIIPKKLNKTEKFKKTTRELKIKKNFKRRKTKGIFGKIAKIAVKKIGAPSYTSAIHK
jgi:hypothetical protein